MAALNFQEQEALSAGQKFLRQGKSLYKEDRQNVHRESKKPMSSLLGGVIVSMRVKIGNFAKQAKFNLIIGTDL